MSMSRSDTVRSSCRPTSSRDGANCKVEFETMLFLLLRENLRGSSPLDLASSLVAEHFPCRRYLAARTSAMCIRAISSLEIPLTWQ
jgi:hypothetical protein